MSDVRGYLWLIPALPLLAAVIAFFGPRFLRGASHWPCWIAVAISCVLSFFVLGAVKGLDEVKPPAREQAAEHAAPAPEHTGGKTEYVEKYYQWARIGNVDVGLTLRADGLSAIMLVTVTFVGLLIVIFAAGYMHGDPGYPRFFA